jgi:Bifunctional DNA primase/polymerase, N-terminal
VWEATCNRARVLAWWSRYPLANIGLACGHRFDVLDLDGPQAVAALADRDGLELPAGGPVVRTGRDVAGWHYYLAPAGLPRRTGLLERVDYQGLGAYVVAPPSRHASGRPYRWVRGLDHPLPRCPSGSGPSSSAHRSARPPRCWSGCRRPMGPGRPMCGRPWSRS